MSDGEQEAETTTVSTTFRVPAAAGIENKEKILAALNSLPGVVLVATTTKDDDSTLISGAIRFESEQAMKTAMAQLPKGVKLAWRGASKANPKATAGPGAGVTAKSTKRGVPANDLLNFRFDSQPANAQRPPPPPERGGNRTNVRQAAGGRSNKGRPRRQQNRGQGHEDGAAEETTPPYPQPFPYNNQYGQYPPMMFAVGGAPAPFAGAFSGDAASHRGIVLPPPIPPGPMLEGHVLCIQNVPFSATNDDIFRIVKNAATDGLKEKAAKRKKLRLQRAADEAKAKAEGEAGATEGKEEAGAEPRKQDQTATEGEQGQDNEEEIPEVTIYDIARSEMMALVYMGTYEMVMAGVAGTNGSFLMGSRLMACSGGSVKVPAPPGWIPPPRRRGDGQRRRRPQNQKKEGEENTDQTQPQAPVAEATS